MIEPRVSAEVAEALKDGRPVVALETTLVAHGFSGGQGLAAALAAEAQVRAAGAVPATIGLADGQVLAGLSQAELERFAAAGPDARKVSARDVGPCLAQRALGATTVGGTLAVCRLLGIAFMGTGGIGGVHRGASATFDISADLSELANTPVAVVCAGVKSILDIALTLEYLETVGVPVVVVGSDEFPSFYSRSSGRASPRRVDDAKQAAAVLDATWRDLRMSRGVCIANPIAVDDEIPAAEIDDVISEALAELSAQGVTGQAVTPFLLSRIVDQTGGRSLTANISLIKRNAALAADVAVEYSYLAK